ncbi:hypothetical protein SAMN04487926_15329 [Paraburkholderia steynii]|uniref:Aminoacyl-tRNA synthetase class I anticodon-binding domain-containing protein n=2 Tax=Paraburkholderia steynii TaxID=1245441 RepID=A0A7Z7FQC1_9BURK|nr:hypothetical protein SAMN04487926_15329 [Paraburkholderia steynii]
MRDKAKFAEDVRNHVCNVLLSEGMIDLAFDAKLTCDEVLDTLQPLLTRNTPFRAQTLLHSALADPRRTLDVLDSTLSTLKQLPQWHASALQDAVTQAAALHEIAAPNAHVICKCWMLFGPSPLNVYSCMQALGRDSVCRRCEAVLESFRSNLMVS